MDLGLKGRSAVLSAASQGLGKACAQSLAAEGVDLTLNARTPERLESAAEEIRSEFGVEVRTIAGDFADPETRKRMLEADPAPDIVVNNPGVRQVPDPYDKIDGESWRYWLEVHFLSSIDFIQAVAPGMRERKFGRIVNMSVSFIKF
ncbi:MAG: SDR family NAD(P)-dependent oxidoreductase, partial [Hyphomicrobiales bacterium]